MINNLLIIDHRIIGFIVCAVIMIISVIAIIFRYYTGRRNR